MKQMTAITVELCTHLFPESKTDIEAIEHTKKIYDRIIELKAVSGIDSTKDIEMHSVLELMRLELINESKKEKRNET